MKHKKTILEKYPYAKIVAANKMYEIHLPTLSDGSHILGKGKTKHQAWKNACENEQV